ncbi:hypothetical protein FL583_00350 [Cryptosporangium phraense]|uniref:Uncharacterized protein n=1 Tax=Cryptosporangium phraense TaxID=2593070 RepID=A0A545AZM0_9ACTN|nr:hypothetical protein FL583_00350 [Cryptosporangium phraense]
MPDFALPPRVACARRLEVEARSPWIKGLTWCENADGRPLVAAAAGTYQVQLWDPQSGGVYATLGAADGDVTSIAGLHGPGLAPRLVTAATDGSVDVWDLGRRERTYRLDAGDSAWAALRAWIEPDGRARAAVSSARPDGSRVELWDLDNGRTIRSFGPVRGSVGDVVAWRDASSGRSRIAIGINFSGCEIWDVDTGRLLQSLESSQEAMWALVTAGRPGRSPLLIAGYTDGTLDVWADARKVRQLVGHTSNIRAAAVLESGDTGVLLISASDDGTVRVWHVASGECVATIESGQGMVTAVAALALHDGRAVVALGSADEFANGRLQVWELNIDPPLVDLPAARNTAPLTSADLTVDEWPVRLTGVRPRPVFTWGRNAALTRWPDGRIVLAAAQTGEVRIWDVHTGATISVLRAPGEPRSLAWVPPGTGSPRLVVGYTGYVCRTWMVEDGTWVERDLAGDGSGGNGVTVVDVTERDGRALIAAGRGDGTIELIDADNGATLQTLGDVGPSRRGLVVGADSAGRTMLASLTGSGYVQVHEVDSGELLADRGPYQTPHIAWVPGRDGTLRLAHTTYDMTSRRAPASPVSDVGWWGERDTASIPGLSVPLDVASITALVLPDGRATLLFGGSGHNQSAESEDHLTDGGAVRFYDAETGAELYTLPGRLVQVFALATLPLPDGRFLLATGGTGDESVRLYTVSGPWARPARAPVALAPVTAGLRHAATGLVTLGLRDLWYPLSWIDQLITATGPDGDDDPGIRRLRQLRWPPAARVGLAALLLADRLGAPRFRPPDGSTPGGQLAHLLAALASDPDSRSALPLPPDDVHAAADRLDGRLITLLRILGPDAVAADPLLPLRLRDGARAMPDVDPGLLGLVGAVSPREEAVRPASANAVGGRPDAGGVGRRGPLTRLLPSQLALPADVLDLRAQRGELLFRQQPVESERPPEPVTLILDTSPSTFGPVENALRTVAHLIVVTLWRAGLPAWVITTDRPGLCLPLRERADLAVLWTRRGLIQTGLETGLATARRRGRPLVVLTDWHRAADHPLAPGPSLRLLTSHVPGDEPDASPGPFRDHLPPHPDGPALAGAVRVALRSARVHAGAPR